MLERVFLPLGLFWSLFPIAFLVPPSDPGTSPGFIHFLPHVVVTWHYYMYHYLQVLVYYHGSIGHYLPVSLDLEVSQDLSSVIIQNLL